MHKTQNHRLSLFQHPRLLLTALKTFIRQYWQESRIISLSGGRSLRTQLDWSMKIRRRPLSSRIPRRKSLTIFIRLSRRNQLSRSEKSVTPPSSRSSSASVASKKFARASLTATTTKIKMIKIWCCQWLPFHNSSLWKLLKMMKLLNSNLLPPEVRPPVRACHRSLLLLGSSQLSQRWLRRVNLSACSSAPKTEGKRLTRSHNWFKPITGTEKVRIESSAKLPRASSLTNEPTKLISAESLQQKSEIRKSSEVLQSRGCSCNIRTLRESLIKHTTVYYWIYRKAHALDIYTYSGDSPDLPDRFKVVR